MPSPSAAARVAGLLTLVEAATLVAVIVFYGYELAQGATPDPVRAVMSAVTIAIFAVGLGLLGRAWLAGRSWPRTPTVVWNALLLPSALSLWGAGLFVAALGVGAIAVSAIAAAVLSGRGDDGSPRPLPR